MTGEEAEVLAAVLWAVNGHPMIKELGLHFDDAGIDWRGKWAVAEGKHSAIVPYDEAMRKKEASE
jgi:hypothetical protein